MAKVYGQTHDIGYDETFASVTKMMTILVLLVATATKG